MAPKLYSPVENSLPQVLLGFAWGREDSSASEIKRIVLRRTKPGFLGARVIGMLRVLLRMMAWGERSRLNWLVCTCGLIWMWVRSIEAHWCNGFHRNDVHVINNWSQRRSSIIITHCSRFGKIGSGTNHDMLAHTATASFCSKNFIITHSIRNHLTSWRPITIERNAHEFFIFSNSIISACQTFNAKASQVALQESRLYQESQLPSILRLALASALPSGIQAAAFDSYLKIRESRP